jgi:hypothetical protein
VRLTLDEEDGNLGPADCDQHAALGIQVCKPNPRDGHRA